MAENIDLNIKIGANVTDLQSQLQKAENLLKQFEAALKKATNVGEINYLNNSIKTLNTTISNLGQQMNKVGRPAGDATNALSNLSRVAQDAPYGFIGIANNLNPLLESFQRLSKESGSSAKALQSMVAGLTGPAGIGLALGVVSSLAVTFSDEIASFFKGPTEKLKEFRAELAKISQDLYKVVGEAQANRTIGLNLVSVIAGGTAAQQEEALKKLKILYKDSKDIQALKIGADTTYMTHLVNMASKQEEYNAKEKNNAQSLSLIYENQKKTIAERDKALKAVKGDIITGGGAGGGASVVTAEQQIANINKRYNPILKELEKQIVSAKSKNLELVTALSVFETPDKKEPKDSEVVAYAKYELKKLDEYVKKLKERVKEAEFVLKNESFKLFELPSEREAKDDKRKAFFEKQAKDLLESTQKEGGFGAYMQGIFKKDKTQLDAEAAEKKRIDDLTQSYAQFAQTLSSNVTNGLFAMYDAMQQGQNPLEAFANAFLQIGKNIAAMVIQALIFEKIMNAFPALKGAFAALGLVGNALSGARVAGSIVNAGNNNPSFNPSGVANNNVSQGQFVIKGSDLVLATQRANNNLNIRRGY
jgi:hypothetical protein